jgi:hypothetical protein
MSDRKMMLHGIHAWLTRIADVATKPGGRILVMLFAMLADFLEELLALVTPDCWVCKITSFIVRFISRIKCTFSSPQ